MCADIGELHVAALDGLHSGIKSRFSGAGFVLALARIRQLAVQIKALEKDALVDLGALDVPTLDGRSRAKREHLKTILRKFT